MYLINKYFLFYSKFSFCRWLSKPFCRNTVHVDSQDAKQSEKPPRLLRPWAGRVPGKCRVDMNVGRIAAGAVHGHLTERLIT